MANELKRGRDRVVRWWRARMPEASEREIRQVKAQLREVTARLNELEAAVQESRDLNLRLAELTDVIQELLVPIAARDHDKAAQLLEKYRDSI